MGDLFHEDVPDAWIDRVFAVMALWPALKDGELWSSRYDWRYFESMGEISRRYRNGEITMDEAMQEYHRLTGQDHG